MICRGPGFLAVVFFVSSSSPSPVSNFDGRYTGIHTERDNLLTGDGGGVAESYDGDGEKAWSSKSFKNLGRKVKGSQKRPFYDKIQ
jgi:hypothetical protein